MSDKETCLPYARHSSCQLCVNECVSAGYNAIEFMQVHTKTDENGLPIEGTGYLAPVVLEHRCVGCGLCQTRCYGINVKEKRLISESAIQVMAGDGREDRMISGSYIALCEEELRRRQENIRRQQNKRTANEYITDFLR